MRSHSTTKSKNVNYRDKTTRYRTTAAGKEKGHSYFWKALEGADLSYRGRQTVATVIAYPRLSVENLAGRIMIEPRQTYNVLDELKGIIGKFRCGRRANIFYIENFAEYFPNQDEIDEYYARLQRAITIEEKQACHRATRQRVNSWASMLKRAIEQRCSGGFIELIRQLARENEKPNCHKRKRIPGEGVPAKGGINNLSTTVGMTPKDAARNCNYATGNCNDATQNCEPNDISLRIKKNMHIKRIGVDNTARMRANEVKQSNTEMNGGTKELIITRPAGKLGKQPYDPILFPLLIKELTDAGVNIKEARQVPHHHPAEAIRASLRFSVGKCNRGARIIKALKGGYAVIAANYADALAGDARVCRGEYPEGCPLATGNLQKTRMGCSACLLNGRQRCIYCSSPATVAMWDGRLVCEFHSDYDEAERAKVRAATPAPSPPKIARIKLVSSETPRLLPVQQKPDEIGDGNDVAIERWHALRAKRKLQEEQKLQKQQLTYTQQTYDAGYEAANMAIRAAIAAQNQACEAKQDAKWWAERQQDGANMAAEVAILTAITVQNQVWQTRQETGWFRSRQKTCKALSGE